VGQQDWYKPSIFGDQVTMIFDIYSRYKACSDLLRQTGFVMGDSVLDIGSGPECLFGQFIPDAAMSYVDPLIPIDSGPGRITGNVFTSELDGQTFDCVTSVDVLEHIPSEHRPAFLQRLASLGKSTLILGFPTSDSSDALETDKAMNDQYRATFGHDYPWLEEHYRCGLPSLAETVEQLSQLGWHCQTVGHGHSPWLRELLSFVLCVWDNPSLNSVVLSVSEKFNRELYSYDFRPPYYRQFVIASRSPLSPISGPAGTKNCVEVEKSFQALMEDARKQYFIASLRHLRHQDAAAAERDGQITSLNQVLSERDEQITSLNQVLPERDGQIAELSAALREECAKLVSITTSRSWRLTLPIREAFDSAPGQQAKRYAREALRLARRIYQPLPFSYQTKAEHRNALVIIRGVAVQFKNAVHILNRIVRFIPQYGVKETFLTIVYKAKQKRPTIKLDSSTRTSLQNILNLLNISLESDQLLTVLIKMHGQQKTSRIIANIIEVEKFIFTQSNGKVYPIIHVSQLPIPLPQTRKRNILFITGEFPNPHHGGGNRVLNFIKTLSADNNIYLCTAFITNEHEQILPCLASYCRKILKIPFDRFGGNQDEIRNWLGETTIDVVHYEWQRSLENYAADFGRTQIFTFMEAVSLRLLMDMERLTSLSPIWLKKMEELAYALWLEFVQAPKVDARIAVTEKDAKHLSNLYPFQEYAVLNHGLDFDEFTLPDIEAEPYTLVFVGNYLHYPNDDAMEFFFNEIWENIRKEIPDIRIYVVGANPTDNLLRRSDGKQIIITGTVADVRPYIQKASVCIAPLISGAGLRGKVIEYAALHRPFVATSIASTDLVFKDGIDYFCADTALEFSKKIITLLKDQQLARRMAETAYVTARQNYDNAHLTRYLLSLYEYWENRPDV
jgi:glycosyltransferase involved in cell wall biosynthesis